MSSDPSIRYPFATIAFFGPTDQIATKATVTVLRKAGGKPHAVQHWHSGAQDAREDASLTSQIISFLQQHQVKHTLHSEDVVGCPHEEGVDFPSGSPCPFCPYWRNRKVQVTAIKPATRQGRPSR
jgi:hypothetical protein